MAGEAICRAAIALIGTPFRLHGRCATRGVDCVGLALLSLRGAGMNVPEPPPYRLRAGAAPMAAGWMRTAGFGEGAGRQPGDLVIVRVSALQPHLLIDAGETVIHAHAGIGRVVRTAMPPEWPELARWRRA
ncbi:MAG TPA: peptidoglycan endopeptidase [Sphingobium sp.]